MKWNLDKALPLLAKPSKLKEIVDQDSSVSENGQIFNPVPEISRFASALVDVENERLRMREDLKVLYMLVDMNVNKCNNYWNDRES